MNHASHLLDVILLLSSAVIVVVTFWKLRVSPVLGYFAAGAAIGSHGFQLVESSAVISGLGEFGVVFLLFLIGIELTFERLAAMRLHVFGFGTLQVIVTATLIWCIARVFGVSSESSVVIGGALAMSSTAIVLQVLHEKGQQSTQVGRLSVAILLLQDFAVIPLIVLLPLLAGESDSLVASLLHALLKAAAAFALIFISGRLLLRPLFSTIAMVKSNEAFMAATLLVVLGAAFVTENFNLSMALGAFVAGLLVAETEYRYDVEQAVLPFKKLLMGLFFMTVGMSTDTGLLISKLPLILALSFALILLKSSIICILCRFFGFQLAVGMHAGLLLCQGGEFAFILFGLAAEKGVLSYDLAQMLMMIATVTMALTPLLVSLGSWISGLLTKKNKTAFSSQELVLDTKDLDQHVIVVGFGRVGRIVAKVLTAEHVNYIASDIQPVVVTAGREEGFPVYLGDLTKLETLTSMGIARAKAIIIAINNSVTTRKIISLVAHNFRDTIIVVRIPDLTNAATYRKLGAHYLIPETYETGLQLGGVALSISGFSTDAIALLQDALRAEDYGHIEE
ncbi:cation:proton antiporter domain-containing protein [Anaplasma capra]|uniref:cation:proton antiporter domain-containing protein n=1 Tax=Anaplasma capra TaxID=1562740 RepID=UPI0021D5AA7F|nr:cation:proton antiporter [Anaplasma capra]MCU7611225.1 cation:proton antiporter [Anaplasma capra]MCU7612597.1 cation:proton antiporter [Anaplasma capra]